MLKKNNYILLLLLLLFLFFVSCNDETQEGLFDDFFQNITTDFVKKYRVEEHFSALALSVSMPNRSTSTYVYGTTDYDGVANITSDTLFEIGSITKSFTSALILQLEEESESGTLGVEFNIDQKLGIWLSQYPNWKNITIKQLLNMTSQIKDYGSTDAFSESLKNDVEKAWEPEELVDLVVSKPLLSEGYSYSNTNYILLGMVIVSVFDKANINTTIEKEFKSRFFEPLNLNNTYYVTTVPSISLQKNMALGYCHIYKGTRLWNTNITNFNLSGAGTAGCLISNSNDILKWVHALYSGIILKEKQLNELKSCISLTTGKPISGVSPSEKSGYGLGIGQSYSEKHGNLWYYEGETFGYRAFYVYTPKYDSIVAFTVNSRSEPDDISKLVDSSLELVSYFTTKK